MRNMKIKVVRERRTLKIQLNATIKFIIRYINFFFVCKQIFNKYKKKRGCESLECFIFLLKSINLHPLKYTVSHRN